MQSTNISGNEISINLAEVHANIEAACTRAGRNSSEITLIAVSKTKPYEMLLDAYRAGERSFGENKVQEICEKYERMHTPDGALEDGSQPEAAFHMIGHLQTNKVRQVVDKVCMIHSVDSLHLAQSISKEAIRIGRRMDILIEVNVAEEESKFGVSYGDAENLVRECAKLPGVHVCGLMTIAPMVENSEENRQIFKKLKQLCVDLKDKNIDNTDMDVLSMGMTGDYQVAIEEGATMIRVGTAIFGARNYNM
ncbi:MAG: YggS family pyridoxal phosphate-dependent enzyme [Lachnospiraceae bacterium]